MGGGAEQHETGMGRFKREKHQYLGARGSCGADKHKALQMAMGAAKTANMLERGVRLQGVSPLLRTHMKDQRSTNTNLTPDRGRGAGSGSQDLNLQIGRSHSLCLLRPRLL